MAVLHVAGAPLTTSGYTLLIADDPTQVAAAQRLRHEVFATELGATLRPGAAGLDVDAFDAHCDHLIVRHESSGEVVGTYRLLPPGRTNRRYAEDEFDLTALDPLRDDLVEAGRSCVHPDHRSGAVINLMWAGIIRYLHLRGSRWLGGCASVPIADGGRTVAEVWAQAQARHLSPPPLRVRPLRPWFAEPAAVSSTAAVSSAAGASAVPPLLRGYLRLGAWICGEPSYDPDFGCADFYVLFSLDRMNSRYLRHFLGEAQR
ncbi:GNAT family N-acyltransferase [Micromonospora profundi]|uniref:GNAT family N-acyltransferase n=1 Tax=Micromonospora profundi TaxID=1420889 RepID=A0AAJ6HV80_9ACTN|nr:GNAT family N-acyltransferase [Micromonospora profundi]WLS47855.1 GNAT family N-acyltransferase [Micromonospora profundi]